MNIRHGIVVACMLSAATFVIAGDTNPPAGPVAPTMKTLTEVEPRIALTQANTPGDANSVFRITTPGSYYLTADLQGVASKHGIKIQSNNVSIDLKGFTLQGVTGSLSGITTSGSSLRNHRIVNGLVTDWDNSGIDLAFAGGSLDSFVSDIRSNANAFDGIRVNANATVRRCTVRNNGDDGIDARSNAVIQDCEARGNSDDGIVTLDVCTVERCTTRANGDQGIAVSDASMITDNVCASNGDTGIWATSFCTVLRNRCSANTVNGIRVGAESQVIGNACDRNGSAASPGAGIDVSGSAGVIESNSVTSNHRGLDVGWSDNLVIRNNASGNTTNYLISAGNLAGTISVTPIGAGACDNFSS